MIIIRIVFTFILLGFIGNNVHCQKVGLVLSGGGAKGLAHIGVIRALEENSIPVDYITGTSMGAIIGALYASGYSPEEMEAIIYTDDFLSWSTGTIPDEYNYYYKNRYTNASLISFQFSRMDSVTAPVFPTNIIPTHSMDLGLLELFAQSSAASMYDFDNLMVPFRCIASDVHANKAVILRKGELSSAVRSSMTYPFYFDPIEIDGVLLFDGGIHNNFPFDIMKDDFEPEVMIGSKVSANAPPPTRDNIRSQIENMMTAQTDYDIESAGGILIDSDLKDVGVLDFHLAKEIIRIGYETTIKNLPEIREKINRRVSLDVVNSARKEFKDDLPPMIFQNIYVTGTSRYQIDYVINSIRQQEDYFTIERLRAEYFKLASDDKISSIYPRALYNSHTGIFDLHLEIESENRIETQLGGNISSTSINQGFAGIEYKFLGRNAYNLQGNIYFGRLYSSVMARGIIEYPGSLPIFGDIGFTLNRWDYFTSRNDPFFEDVRPSYLIQYDGNFKISLGAPVTVNSIAKAGYSMGRISDRYYQTTSFLKSDTTDKTDYNVNSINFMYERNTFNYLQYPTRGRKSHINMQLIRGVERFTPGSTSNLLTHKSNEHYYLLMEASSSWYFRINNRLTLGIAGEIVASTQEFFSNYTSTLLNTPAFQPFPHSYTLFLENYRAPQYAGAGIVPIVKMNDQLHLRFEAYIFQPYKKIGRDELLRAKYLERFGHNYFLGSAGIIYHTPIGPASLNLNYYEKRGQKFFLLFNFGYILFNDKTL